MKRSTFERITKECGYQIFKNDYDERAVYCVLPNCIDYFVARYKDDNIWICSQFVYDEDLKKIHPTKGLPYYNALSSTQLKSHLVKMMKLYKKTKMNYKINKLDSDFV